MPLHSLRHKKSLMETCLETFERIKLYIEFLLKRWHFLWPNAQTINRPIESAKRPNLAMRPVATLGRRINE